MTATSIAVKTNDGKKIMLNRASKATPDYTVPSIINVGIDQTLPNVLSSTLVNPVPILDGTVLDPGDNTMTGSDGGDNSTNNTDTYKDGAGVSDVTAQNLIKNNTNATAIWTIAALDTNATAASYIGLWLYIKDATALAKFKSSGTAFEVKVGSSAANYYSNTYELSDLAVGWNWISSYNDALSGWTETGTVAGNIDTFILEITTNNAADTFVAGDVVYDLLRQWVDADLNLAVTTVTNDEGNLTTEYEFSLGAGAASGFLLNGALVKNTDGSVLVSHIAKHEENSKSDTDIFVYTFVDRLI